MIVATITFTFRDNKGKLSSTSVNVPQSVGVAAMIEFATQFAQLLTPLTRGALVGISISISFGELPPGTNSTPWEDSDVEEGLWVQMVAGAGNHYTSMRIPTLDESLIVDGTDVVDWANADVAALVAALEDGFEVLPAGGVAPDDLVLVQPVDTRGEDVTLVVDARETFQASGRRRG